MRRRSALFLKGNPQKPGELGEAKINEVQDGLFTFDLPERFLHWNKSPGDSREFRVATTYVESHFDLRGHNARAPPSTPAFDPLLIFQGYTMR